MSFRLFSVSSMYSGYLDLFYKTFPDIEGHSYEEHKKLLLDDTTEFVGSYIRNFRKLGIEADFVICNDSSLQKKWSIERGIDPEKKWDILLDQIQSFRPDILLIENLSYVTSELLNNARLQVPTIRIIAANHGSPFNSKVIESLKGVDFVITCTPGLKSYIEAMGKRSFLVYHGFDTDQLKWLNPESEVTGNDFIFSGSLITGGDFHAQRIHLIEKLVAEKVPIDLYVNLENKYRIRAKQSIYYLSRFVKSIGLSNTLGSLPVFQYGKTWVDSYSPDLLKSVKSPVYGQEMLNLFQRSKIVLNFHIGIAGDYAGNMRMFEVTGVGSCLLTDNKKNMNELFDTEREVVVYDNEEDCVAKIRWLLDHEGERSRIAACGQQKTLKYHTVENRCMEIIDILKKELRSSGTN